MPSESARKGLPDFGGSGAGELACSPEAGKLMRISPLLLLAGLLGCKI